MKPKNNRSTAKEKKVSHPVPTALLLIIIVLLLATVVILYQMRPGREKNSTTASVTTHFEPTEDYIYDEDLGFEEGESTDVSFAVGVAPEEEPEPEILVEQENNTEVTDEDTESTEEETEYRERDALLYFIRVNNDGMIGLYTTHRSIEYLNSPLTRTIATLLAGPDSEELSSGYLTLIPQNTGLLSARVSDGVVFLNFNEAFRFNPLGIEGYAAQLQQIVFTATEFPNVDAVQFMIEGSVYDYLGAEGIYVGAPLSRDDFQ